MPAARSPIAWILVGFLVFFVGARPRAAEGGEFPAEPAAPPLSRESAQEAVEGVRSLVEQIRGLSFRRPVPVTLIDDAQAREYATQRFRRFLTAEDVRADARALALLGLLPPDTDVLGQYLDVLGEQAGGLYDPPLKTLFLLQDVPRPIAPVLAAHELAHALEDQHYDLEASLKKSAGNDDLEFALSAVREGSANLVMGLYVTRALRDGTLRAEDLQPLAVSEAGKAKKLAALAPALRRPLLGSYLLGAAFLLRGDPEPLATRDFPRRDVERAFRDGPRSSEQILHPEKYWDPDRRDDPRPVELGETGKLLGTEWKRARSGVLGELILGLLVGALTPAGALGLPPARAADWTNEAASGWGGDRWELWTKGDAAVALLSTVWDSERDAEEFARALPGARPGFLWRRSGARVALVAGDAGDKAERLLRRMTE